MQWIFRLITACVVTGLSALSAAASPITYEFSVEATSGPLSGTISGGTLTFDDSIVPPGGGEVLGVTLLGLDFTWNGITYDESTVLAARLAFDAFGSLVDAFFGSNCEPGQCSLDTATKGWHVDFFDGPGFGLFSYTAADSITFYDDNPALLDGPVRPVPEPASLLLLGVAGCGAILRRMRRSG